MRPTATSWTTPSSARRAERRAAGALGLKRSVIEEENVRLYDAAVTRAVGGRWHVPVERLSQNPAFAQELQSSLNGG